MQNSRCLKEAFDLYFTSLVSAAGSYTENEPKKDSLIFFSFPRSAGKKRLIRIAGYISLYSCTCRPLLEVQKLKKTVVVITYWYLVYGGGVSRRSLTAGGNASIIRLT